MKLFEAREYDYSDRGEQKPILYDETFFNDLLKECDKVEIQSTHDGDVIGYAENLYFEDGWLHGDIPVDLNGKGLSPRFDVYLLDKGDYKVARDGSFEHIALTDNPRSHILYNEIKGTDNMGESTDINEVLSNRVKELERELAVANNQLESYKKKLENYNELEKQVKELTKANSEFESQIASSKEKVAKWDEYVDTTRNSLIDELAEGNEAMKEEFKSWNIDQLRFLKENKPVTTEPQGVGNGISEGLNEGSNDDNKEAERTERLETVRGMFSELNVVEE